MKNRFFTKMCCLLFFPSWITAQSVAPQVTNNYPASIVIRVNEVASKVIMDNNMQILLADHFVQSDSLLAAAIKRGAVRQEIQAMEYVAQARFRKLVGPALEQEYYTRSAGDNASLEATAYASFMKKKYDTDTLADKILFNNYYRQKVQLDKTIRQYSGTPELEKRLADIMTAGDSVNEKYTQLIKSLLFIKKKRVVLDAIKPLTAKEAVELQRTFISICGQKNEGSYGDNFNEALRKVIHDTLYYAALYKEEISKQANANARREMGQLVKEKQITREGVPGIKELVYAKERSLTTLQYAFPSFTRYKDSLMLLVTRNYDSLISIALMKDGNFRDISQFATAIKYREKLGLAPVQEDSLFSHAVTLQFMRDEYTMKFPLGKFDPSPYESTNLSRILSDDQYRLLLAEKNRTQATEWANGDWEELKKRGMAGGYDSAVVISQLMQYNINRLVARDRYANNKILQNAYITDIDVNMPVALRRLKAARNTDNVVNATKPKEVKNTFKW